MVRRLRTALLPVLLLAVVAYAVAGAAQERQEPAAPAASELLLPEPLGELWTAWGEDLAPGRAQDYPTSLAALDRDEALYVLLTVRAAQLAEAVDRAGPSADVEQAGRDAGLGPQPDVVAVAAVPEQPGCIALTYADETFGRSYFGWAQAPVEPGPDPESPLEALLLRTARVGLLGTDRATCGNGVAYSPPAQRVLTQLSPALLSD